MRTLPLTRGRSDHRYKHGFTQPLHRKASSLKARVGGINAEFFLTVFFVSKKYINMQSKLYPTECVWNRCLGCNIICALPDSPTDSGNSFTHHSWAEVCVSLNYSSPAVETAKVQSQSGLLAGVKWAVENANEFLSRTCSYTS